MDLSFLNNEQRSAVLDTLDCNSTIFSPAGSGKTKTLITRIEYLIKELNVPEDGIMAITFTNKAVNEIRNRLYGKVTNPYDMWIGTFHNICVKILKECGEEINIKDFTILDAKESTAVLKEAIISLGYKADKVLLNSCKEKISSYKNEFTNYRVVLKNASNNNDVQFARIYEAYENICWKRRTFDFDDLIIYTIILLTKSKNTREYINDKFKYIMVDEAQDTNKAQMLFIKLTAGNSNIFLVGDANQSIYRWRGARPELFLHFNDLYADSKIIKMRQNYRSTKTIIGAANAIISHSTETTDNDMFTNNPEGDPIIYSKVKDNFVEAKFIVNEINCLHDSGKSYKDCAILYRTGSQSRVLEEELLKYKIPYSIVGSINFYGRKEIKDLMAYVKLYANHKDVVSFQRVLSLQSGIGKSTVEKILKFAEQNFISDCIEILEQYNDKPRTQIKLNLLTLLFANKYSNVLELVETVLQETGYMQDLINEDTKDSKERIDNIEEFKNVLKEHENDSIIEFVDKVSLMTDEGKRKDGDKVSLLTIHAAKGLEFNTVFLCGVEQGILPHINSMNSDSAMQEELRSMYVAVTRAIKTLYITSCQERNAFGKTTKQAPSEFVDYIPEQYIIRI